MGREGDQSYIVELKSGGRQTAHRSQLRPHVMDLYTTDPYPLYYFTGKAPEVEVGPGEYIPGSVVGMRTYKAGQPEVLVQ